MKPTTPGPTRMGLPERVKELECLYAIARLSPAPHIEWPEFLQRVADLLPAAWKCPEQACAQIELDERLFLAGSPPMKEQRYQQAKLLVRGVERGRIRVGYPDTASKAPRLLDDEQRLLDEVARQIAHVIDRRETQQAHEDLQARLRQTDHLASVGRLASGVAHELNEPLGCILGFVQLLKKREDLPGDAHPDLDKIESATLHARETIRKLMVFARQSTSSKARVALNQLLHASVSLCQWRCEDGGVLLQFDLDNELPDIHGDAEQIRQMLTNLLVNAVHAMPEGGLLTLSTRHCRQHVQVSVADTGCGMSDEIRERMFDPFFTTKEVDQGMGLGLSLVHGIVSAHAGTLDVESAPGRGTTIQVTFPLPPSPSTDQQERASDRHAI